MLRRLLGWLGLRKESDSAEDADDAGDEEAEEEAEEDGGFVPSRLDASVLAAHGMGTGTAERELASIEEKAETLESERPDEHRHDHER